MSEASRARGRAWRSKVAPYFQYLVDEFGMRVIKTHAWSWEDWVVYGRNPIGVKISASREDWRVELWLIRLVGGKIPPYPIFIHPDTAIHWAQFDHILHLRAPSELEQLAAHRGLDDYAAIDGALEFLAGALHRHASDFLAGDTAVFDDVDRLIKARIAGRPPQKMTLHVPEGTPAEAVDRTVDKARHIDPQVPVEVRTYRRSGRPGSRK